MDRYGKIIRTITRDGKNCCFFNGSIYYEAVIIEKDNIEMLYIKITNLRYDTPEHIGTHFNIEWIEKDEDRDWLAARIGDAMCLTASVSNTRTTNEIKSKTNALMKTLDINLNFGLNDG